MARSQKSDSAILGGLASGIGGPAAGVVTALKVEQKNKQVDDWKQNAMNNYISAASSERKLSEQLSKDIETLNNINDKLIDTKNILKKMELINIENMKCEVLPSKNFKFTCEVHLPENINIVDEPAVLDGTLKIYIKDRENNVVAEGLFSAPGLFVTDFSKIGFNVVEKIKTICISYDGDNINQKAQYTCEVEALNLWLIEKK